MDKVVSYDPETEVAKIVYWDESGSALVSEAFQFQHGPVGDNGYNGVQNEDVLKILITRLRALNAKFPCRENSLAITKIEEALMWLERRTKLRQEQGVEGQNVAHVS